MSNTDSEEKTKGDVYYERNLLAIAFVFQCRQVDALTGEFGDGRHYGWWPDTDDVNGEEWAVVWANIPVGDGERKQVGWHVPREMVPSWMGKRDPEYDGYTTREKNGRLAFYAGVPEKGVE